jgi:hypothetical protein
LHERYPGPPCLPLEPPGPLSFQVLLVERDVQGLLQDLRHVLQGVLDSQDFRQALELFLELAVGSEAKVELIRPCRLEDTG